MPAGTQFPVFNQQFFDYSGIRPFPAAGYKLWQYESGTTTDQLTQTDPALMVDNEQPITLDAAGKCTMFADPSLTYTFVLKTPAGVTVDTWDDVVSIPLPLTDTFVHLDGSTPMTGLLVLSGDAEENLGAVTLQQMNSAITAVTASVTAAVDSATAAAAAATAAAAAIRPTSFRLATVDGGAATRDINLSVGTWSCMLDTRAEKDDGGGSYSAFDVTQAASVGTTSLATTITFARVGGGGYGRDMYGHDIDIGTLTVPTAGPYTMTLSAVSLGSATSKGSIFSLELIA